MQESYQETAMLWHRKGSPTSTNDTYLWRRNLNIIKFSVLIYIIIIVKYISVIY